MLRKLARSDCYRSDGTLVHFGLVSQYKGSRAFWSSLPGPPVIQNLSPRLQTPTWPFSSFWRGLRGASFRQLLASPSSGKCLWILWKHWQCSLSAKTILFAWKNLKSFKSVLSKSFADGGRPSSLAWHFRLENSKKNTYISSVPVTNPVNNLSLILGS